MPQPLSGCHCAAVVLGIWRRSLPSVVRNSIADMDFNNATYTAVFDKADSVWSSNSASVTVAATLATPQTAEVAAVSSNRGGRNNNNRGGGRGGGNANNRGGGNANNRGGGSNRGGANGSQGQSRRGPRHPDLPPNDACGLHWKFGKGAWTCADRHKCPWRDLESPRPRHDRNINAAEIID